MVYIILQLALPPPLNILKLGAYRGIQECRNQFENDSSWWNCTFDWKRVDRTLPIFINNTLPHGKNIFVYLWYLWKGGKGWEGGGRHSREIWVEVYGRGLQTLQTVLNTKIVHFASLFKTREIILWRSWFILFSNKMDFFFSQNYGIWLFRKKHLWYHKFRPFIVTLLSKKTPFPRR